MPFHRIEAADLPAHRLSLMRQLADSLQTAQSALASMDLTTFERATADQLNLCRELRESEMALRQGFQSSNATQTTDRPELSAADDPKGSVLAECRDIEHRLRVLNRTHAALLRQSRHSLQVFANLLESAAVAYAPPNREAELPQEKTCQT
jgi:hypothetical protein